MRERLAWRGESSLSLISRNEWCLIQMMDVLGRYYRRYSIIRLLFTSAQNQLPFPYLQFNAALPRCLDPPRPVDQRVHTHSLRWQITRPRIHGHISVFQLLNPCPQVLSRPFILSPISDSLLVRPQRSK